VPRHAGMHTHVGIWHTYRRSKQPCLPPPTSLQLPDMGPHAAMTNAQNITAAQDNKSAQKNNHVASEAHPGQ
jgi:hypothetical protein